MKINKLVLLLVLISIIYSCNNSAKKENNKSSDTLNKEAISKQKSNNETNKKLSTNEDVIKKIKEMFSKITNNPNEHQYFSYSAEEGQIYLDSSNNVESDLKLIVENYFSNPYATKRSYYLLNNDVFFIFEQKTPIIENPEEYGVEKENNRYYLNKEKLIKWLDTNKKNINTNSKDFKEKSKYVDILLENLIRNKNEVPTFE